VADPNDSGLRHNQCKPRCLYCKQVPAARVRSQYTPFPAVALAGRLSSATNAAAGPSPTATAAPPAAPPAAAAAPAAAPAADEEEEDDSDEEPPADWYQPANRTGLRQSVSAEAYGEFNQKTDFTPPVYPKEPEVVEKLKATLMKSFLFSTLDDKDFEKVILAVEEVKFEADAVIIQEGDSGDCLYLIEEGKPVCKKKIGDEEKVVKECSPGDVFGELALLYNCPRAASVIATDAAVCWKLDRGTFNAIVKNAAANQRIRHQNFLKSVDLLAELTDADRSQVTDAMKIQKFKIGDTIIKQGDSGDTLYIVEVGTLVAKATKDGGEEVQVKDYKEGDYFGELALIKDQPRAVSVIATSDVEVLCLDRVSFEAMLGGLKDMLGKNAEKYVDIMNA